MPTNSQNVKAAAVELAALGSLIDEHGELDALFARLKPKSDRLRTVKEEIRAHFLSGPPEASFQVEGARYVALIGPRANESRVSIPRLLKAIGAMRFREVATVTLTAMRAVCTTEQAIACTDTEQTGARSLKTVEKRAA